MATVEIRTAQQRDLPQIAAIEIASKIASVPQWTEPHELNAGLRLESWKAYMDGRRPQSAKPQRIILISLVEGQYVGYLAGHLSTRFGMDAEIQSFYVLKDFQRRGLGSALLLSFLAWLDNYQASGLCVGFHPKNPYKAFYLKFGGTYINDHWIGWTDLEKLREKLQDSRLR